MSDDDRYAAAVERCEAMAKKRGHTLGVWYPVDEQLHAAMCEICGAMAWVTRPSYETLWRVGGTALEQGCLQENRGSESGA